MRPLLAIAELARGDWPERATEVALLVSSLGEEDETPRVQLLGDIRRVFESKKVDKLSSKDLVWGLIALEGRPWGEWRAGKPMTQVQLARMLKPFGLRPYMNRFGEETRRGYRLEGFEDAFSRYVPPEPEQAQQCDEAAPKSPTANRNSSADVSPEGKPETPHRDCIVAGVSDPEAMAPQRDDAHRPGEI